MKVESSNVTFGFTPTDRTERTGSGQAKRVPAGRHHTQGDRVHLSGQSALLAAAQRAAAESPDLRHDLIAKVKARLDAGEVGTDAERLADRLIDHLLGS